LGVVDSGSLDRTNLHRIWRAILVFIALGIATACCFAPVLLIAIGVLLFALLCARLVYRDRDRYIPNLYARDIKIYDDEYQAFISRSLIELRECRIPGHPLLWEASRLSTPLPGTLTNYSLI